MQREREAEGDLYKDKESFVTQAYKDQMEQVRKAEEEEKKREGLYAVVIYLFTVDLLSFYQRPAKSKEVYRRGYHTFTVNCLSRKNRNTKKLWRPQRSASLGHN